MDIKTREEYAEIFKNDPFIKMWRENYNVNLDTGRLSRENSKPLMYIPNTQPYSNLPMVLVAAGPSLDKNIHVLKEHKDKFLIMCADINLFRLLGEGIKPDFVVNLDPQLDTLKFWEDIDTTGLTLISSTLTNPKLLDVWKGNIFFFNQIDLAGTPKGEALKKIIDPTKGWGNIFNRYFVGATMFQLSSIFKPSFVSLIGYDFAYTDDKMYCDGVVELKLKYVKNAPNYKEIYDGFFTSFMKKELLAKLSNNTEVWTSNLLHFYKVTLEQLFKGVKFPVINCTEGGILDSIPRMSLEECVVKNNLSPIVKKDIFNAPNKKRRHKRGRKK